MNIKDSYIHNGTAVLKDIKVESSVLKKILAGKDANDAYLDWETVCDLTGIKPTAAGTADKVGHKLTFTGGVTGDWDGYADKTVAIPTKASWNYDDVYLKLSGGTLTGNVIVDDEKSFKFIQNRSAGGWAWAPIVFTREYGEGSNDFFWMGAFGNGNGASDYSYAYLGMNEAYNSANNLRLYSDSVKFGNNVIYHAGNLSIGTLMGSTAIGDSDEPVYWSGSAFVKAGAYPTKSSWNYDDVYLKDVGLDTGNSTDKNKDVSLTNGNVYLKLFKSVNGAESEDSKVKIYGATNISVTTDASGDIKITGVDSVSSATNATYAANVGVAGTAGTNYVTAANVISMYNWYNTVTADDAANNTAIDKWNEIISFLAGLEDTSTLSGLLAGKANSSHNHDASHINSGTLGIARGGTGKSSWTQYGIVYASATDTLAQITVPSTASKTYWLKCVTNGASVPTYSFAELPEYPTLTGLMGNSAKGGTTTPIYWNGSSFVNCTAYESASVLYADSAGSIPNFKKIEFLTGKTYIGWVTFAKMQLNEHNYYGNISCSIFLGRNYNSPSSEAYVCSFTSGWLNGTIKLLSKSIGTQIITKLRIALDSTNHILYFQVYVNTAYTTYDNTTYAAFAGFGFNSIVAENSVINEGLSEVAFCDLTKGVLADDSSKLNGHEDSYFSEATHTHSLKINGSEYTINASSGTAVDIGTYLPYKQYTTNQNANDMTDGWHNVQAYVSNCGTTSNHGTLIQNSYCGTPFQIWIPDVGYYIYKRYNSGSIGGTWSKISAGYADSAGSADTATNLASAPSLLTSGNTVAVNAGGKTSSYITIPYATNADKVDDMHLSMFYKHGYNYPYGTSDKPWGLIAEHTQSNSGQINTAISFFVSEFYSAASYGILTIRCRAEAGSTQVSWLKAEWTVCNNINTSDFVVTWKIVGTTWTLRLYCRRTGWSSYAFRKIEEQSWGQPLDTWVLFDVFQTTGTRLAEIPSGETQVESEKLAIDNSVSWSAVTDKPATATRWPAWSEVTNKPSIWDITSNSAANYSVSNTGWTNTITLPTDSGSYILTLITGNSTLTGVFSIGSNDNAKDEISLHLHGNGPRLYARTNGTTLQLSSNDASATSRSIVIKYKRLT